MKSEITPEFLALFRQLPDRVKKSARKNYSLWKNNHHHPGLDFKKLNTNLPVYSVRVGIGWRAVGVSKDADTIVWFWIGSHSEYDKLISSF